MLNLQSHPVGARIKIMDSPGTPLLKNTLQIAVRELVEYTCRSGDLEMGIGGARRAAEAIRAHRKVQQSRPAHYAAEVPVQWTFESEDFRLVVSGRIDGVFATGNNQESNGIVEEIKTTTENLQNLDGRGNPLHWGQVKVYAYMLARLESHEILDVQLTYYQLDTGEVRSFRDTYSREELENFTRDLVEQYLQWARTLIEWRELRDASIRTLTFPHDRYRPGQRAMAVEVFRAVRDEKPLLVQAATGIGKTLAAVFPAVKAMGEGLTTKIFYLTARTTTRTVAEHTVTTLRAGGLRLKTLTLTAKDKICPEPEAVCSGRQCPYARGYYERLRDALPQIFQQDRLDRSTVEEAAAHWRLCPFALSLVLSHYADCIICDYNYAFDPRAYLRHFFDDEGAPYTFLVDEAHNLVERARDMFSAELSRRSFAAARKGLRGKHSGLYRSLGNIAAWMRKSVKNAPAGQERWSETEPPAGLEPLLRRFAGQAERWLVHNEESPLRPSLLEIYFTVIGFLRIYEIYDRNYATCYDSEPGDARVKLFCIDPSVQLGASMNRCRTAVFFSATLRPMDYYRTMFGLEPTGVQLTLPSPFPSRNFGVFISHHISTYYRQREDSLPQVVDAVHALVSGHNGNYLLFFPSYPYMLQAHQAFTSVCPDLTTIIQVPEMSEADRRAFLQRFDGENRETLVGFAVMGGIFGEGIDLVGERLSGAAVVGVGLPGICLERELIRAHFDRDRNAGFEFAYMLPGLSRVLQAAGRVIRTENDRGVLLLIDRRFGTTRYRSLLPREWDTIPTAGGEGLRRRLAEFWDRTESAGKETRLQSQH
jgi:DNA excision repair protein ERCC-2